MSVIIDGTNGVATSGTNLTSTSLILNGSTSGAITLAANATAGTNTLTLPAATGTILTTASTGTVLQVVSSTLNTYTSIASSTYTATGLSVSITPKFSTSKILIIGHLNATNPAQQGFFGALFKNASVLSGAVGSSSQSNAQLNGVSGGTTIASGGSVAYGSQPYLELPIMVHYLDSPATTSATTYAIYARTGSGGTIYINYQNSTSTNVDYGYYASTITVMEIAG